jgi:hypothetical protein
MVAQSAARLPRLRNGRLPVLNCGRRTATTKAFLSVAQKRPSISPKVLLSRKDDGEMRKGLLDRTPAARDTIVTKGCVAAANSRGLSDSRAVSKHWFPSNRP